MRGQLLVAIFSAAIVGVIAMGSAPALAQQKTAKACEDEWTTSKVAIQASGKKKKDFITECRAGTSATTAAPPPGASEPSAKPAAAKPATKPAATRPATTGTPAAANEFASEALAKAHCPADTVVWANLTSKIYHYSDSNDYGKTKKGAYMCEKDTAATGIRPAKNEKRPG